MKSMQRWAWLSAAALMVTGCAAIPTHAPSFIIANSSIARDEAALYRDILYEAVFIFLVVIVMLVWSLIRGARHGKDKALPPQVHGKATWAIAVAIAIVAFDGFDFGLMVDTMNKVHVPPAAAQDLNVHVIGHRWWWEFDYTDLGFKTANELHVPVGTNVQITLDSVDVIHSFWAPQLTGKTDAIPGQTNRMWLTAEQPGDFHGQCSEFCGTEHAMMRLQVIAESQADFDAWVANQQMPAAQPQTEAEQAGYEILTSTCSTCHSLDPNDSRTDLVGPNLAHLFSRSTFAGATYPLDEAHVRSWVKDTQAMKPGNYMNINLPSKDFENVIAYLKLLK